ncbi:MAG: ABC transporter ATP-binding protein, partial [Acidobacteriota bacterium]
ENIILGQEPARRGWLNQKEAQEAVMRLADSFDIEIAPHKRTEELSVSQQQEVEILKALYRGGEIIILDEPTSLLTTQQTSALFRLLRGLKKRGKTIILITHRLSEVLQISDRITVMRSGRVVDVLDIVDATEEKLAHLIMGDIEWKPVTEEKPSPEEVIFRVENLSLVTPEGLSRLKNISFSLRKGEILGLAGVAGSGQKELLEVLSGLRPCISGKVWYRNRELTHLAPKEVREQGIAIIPDERQILGLILDFKLKENLILGQHHRPPYCRRFSLNHRHIGANTQRLIEEFNIQPPNPELETAALSGGNQQRVILARELSQNPGVIIASEPTRGLDLVGRRFVHHLLFHKRNNGKAILLMSSQLEEILELSDRIAVLRGGEIISILSPQEVDIDRLGMLMTTGRYL